MLHHWADPPLSLTTGTTTQATNSFRHTLDSTLTDKVVTKSPLAAANVQSMCPTRQAGAQLFHTQETSSNKLHWQATAHTYAQPHVQRYHVHTPSPPTTNQPHPHQDSRNPKTATQLLTQRNNHASPASAHSVMMCWLQPLHLHTRTCSLVR